MSKPALAAVFALTLLIGACTLPKTPPKVGETPDEAAAREEKDRAAQEAADAKTADTIDATGENVAPMLPPPFNWIALAATHAASYYVGRRARKPDAAPAEAAK